MGRTSDTKEKLIESAVQLIGARSYNTVGVQELCEHAGVKKGSFYHFFPSKSDLTLEALDSMWAEFKSNMLDPVFGADCSATEKFNHLLLRSYAHHSNTKDKVGCVIGCSIGNLAVELSTQDEKIRQRIEELFNEWAKYFEKLIIDAIDEGSMPENTDPLATSQAILAYIEGLSLLGRTFNDPSVMSRLGEGVLGLCITKKQMAAEAG